VSTEPQQRNLVVTRVFDAPLEQIWKAWSDSEQVRRWWGPAGFTCPVAKMDFREGGTSLVCMRAPKSLVARTRTAIWWTLRSRGCRRKMPKEVRNEVTFREVGKDETEVTVTENDWTVGRLMEMSKMGLEQCLDKMAALFSR
jgi:uncharacterized protein YndB with AHSA1/START domain